MNTILHPVRYEQLWPCDLLEEQGDDFDLLQAASDRPEIAWLRDQGYHAVTSVTEHVTTDYIQIVYKFWIRSQDLTALLIKFPKATNSYNV
jgi:hypothetical protein